MQSREKRLQPFVAVIVVAFTLTHLENGVFKLLIFVFLRNFVLD
jgi:hypothetical protein